MKKKILIICSIVIIALIALWFTGVIPKQIGKIYGINYVKNNFPKMQLEFVNIEWSKHYGDYIITFKDKENEKYSCVIGPKYFPISIGQGMFEIQEEYGEKYGIDINNTKASTRAVVVKVNENILLVSDTENMIALYSVGIKNFKDLKFEKGQEILIYHSGAILETYPAQFGKIGKIEIIEKQSNKQIPDDIIRFCYNTKENVNVSVNELTRTGITLTIIDKNDLPYNYSHSYIIDKKVKNQNYTGLGQIIGKDTENTTSGFTRNRNGIYMGRSKENF